MQSSGFVKIILLYELVEDTSRKLALRDEITGRDSAGIVNERIGSGGEIFAVLVGTSSNILNFSPPSEPVIVVLENWSADNGDVPVVFGFSHYGFVWWASFAKQDSFDILEGEEVPVSTCFSRSKCIVHRKNTPKILWMPNVGHLLSRSALSAQQVRTVRVASARDSTAIEVALGFHAIVSFMAMLGYVSCNNGTLLSSYVSELVLVLDATHMWFLLNGLLDYILPDPEAMLENVDAGASMVLPLVKAEPSHTNNLFTSHFRSKLLSVKSFLTTLGGVDPLYCCWSG